MFDKAKDAALRQVEDQKQVIQTAYDRLRETQDQLIQQEKLASLGALVAGVAHELNTPIGVALTTASTLQHASREIKRNVDGGDLRKSSLISYLDDAMQMSDLVCSSCHRAALLITSFKRVAVNQTSELRQDFGLRTVVDDHVATLRSGLRTSGVNIEVDVPDDIQCDSYPGPLGQVIVNLVQNAILHAFDGRDIRVIRISARSHPGVIEIQVCDNGCGIPDNVLTHIFDPFFTTKLGQGGTGLGLSVSLNIVTGVLGGKLHVRSTVSEGTCFTLTIPPIAPAAPP